MDRTKLQSLRKCFWTTSILLVVVCHQSNPPPFWPESGTTFQDISWEIPVADSTSVLQTQAGCWILPQPPDTVSPKITVTKHRTFTGHPYQEPLGQVDQEVLHDSGAITREFYRFGKEGIMLVGYETRDSTDQLTVYEPPLVLIPKNVSNLDTTFVHEQIPKVWDATIDSFRQEQKTRVRLVLEQKGSVLLDSFAVFALLYDITLSADKTVAFGGTDLIVPDALILQSKVLIAQGVGPVLEWGVRSRKKEGNEFESQERILDSKDTERSEEWEHYIEVTLHRKISESWL
ncbi:MAG: hypothetical protein JSV84_10570 [Gemmatimonadota bacterium]|nr:MAG: hypothetical protein JSV84_10570 [Gemmatimonadota bacterium]